mmetsp:Transcript_1712/g.5172  ORF Transcript_1712/g.5172 Transcript_1712/m.5172 type:complete len:99 (-) Transcript_1712:133-429(-)
MQKANGATLSAYRALLRAQRKTFSGDAEMMKAASARLKGEFIKHKDETDKAKISFLVEEARKAEDFLLKNVVQARLNAKGRYVVDGAKLDPSKIDGLG